MCISTQEMNETMAAIQEWKRIKEEAEDNITALNAKAIEFLRETETREAVDKKGNPIRKFIGNIFKATLSEQSRETVDGYVEFGWDWLCCVKSSYGMLS